MQPMGTKKGHNTENSAWGNLPESGEGLAFENFLTYRLGRLSTLAQRVTTQSYLEPFDLSLPEWRVLSRLARSGSVEMRQLTQSSLMDKAAISRTVVLLVQRGFAHSHVDPAHAKRRIVAISPAGRKLVRRILPHAVREQARLLHMLNPQERVALDLVIAKLTQSLMASGTS